MPRLCTTALEIPHSNRIGDNHCTGVVGDTCEYVCDEGYSVGSHFQAVCTATGAFEGGSCQAVQCGTAVPGLDEHATASCAGDTGYGGDECMATCDEGYRNDAIVAMYVCSASGEWQLRDGDPPLVCAPEECSRTSTSVEHSHTECEGRIGDRCDFVCIPGFVVSGMAHICGPAGHFEGGSCQPLPCERGKTLRNSNRDKRHSNPCVGTTGARCDYTCNDGYAPTGEHVCGADGRFSGGSCESAQCSDPPAVEHGQTTCTFSDHATQGDRCDISCTAGFSCATSPCMTAVATCESSGEWSMSGGGLVCEDADECLNNNACHPHEPCINTVGSFQCGECEEGYHGDGDGGCLPNECLAGATILHSDRTDLNPCTGVFGQSCVFQCDDGYVRAQSEHVCGAHGSFEGGSCVAEDCTLGLTIGNSNRDEEHQCSGMTGDMCEYICVDGFLAVGDHVCGADGVFSGGACAAIDCGPAIAGLPEHASALCVGDTTLGGDLCLATCDEGYRAASGDVASLFECGTDGLWEGSVTCMEQLCELNSVSDRVDHGELACAAGSYPIGGECAFTCDAGFVAAGVHACQPDGHFGGGVCRSIPCGAGSTIENSNRDQSNPCDGSNGEECAYVCHDGFRRSGPHVCTVDGESGQWNGGGCEPVTCGDLPTVANAQPGASCNSGPEFPLGAACEYQCLPGFDGTGSATYICSGDGQWEEGDLFCEDLPECTSDASACAAHETCTETAGGHICGDCEEGYHQPTLGSQCLPNDCAPGVVEHSDMSAEHPCVGSFGDVCEFVCEAGFTPIGTHSCGPAGVFAGGACIGVPCTNAIVIPHSNRGDDHPCAASTGESCEYTCDDGYAHGGDHVCTPAGVFEGGSCRLQRCTFLPGGVPEHATAACTDDAADTCVVECNVGFRGGEEFASEFFCGADGVWTGELTCTAEPCRKHANIANSDKSRSKCVGSVGDECVYTCDDGFSHRGPHVCGANTHWDGGGCDATACPEGSTVANSNRDARNPCAGTVGQACSYVCNDGYVKGRHHVCTADGAFRGGSCEAVSCPAIGSVEHAVSSCNATQAGQFGDRCTSHCAPGFAPPHTEYTRICEDDGTWLGESLQCVDVDECIDMSAYIESTLGADGSAMTHPCHPHEPCINTVGSFQCGECEEGYHGDGDGGCLPNECLAGATILHSDRTDLNPCTGVFGQSCVFQCDDGYVRAQSEHVCGAHGSFEGGSCVAEDCTLGLTIGNSNRDEEHQCSGMTGDMCEYICVDGFLAVGDHVCGADGVFSGGACAAIDCGPAIAGLPEHASATCMGNTWHDGDPCLATCDEGFRGAATIATSYTCGADGMWATTVALACPAEQCKPTQPEHALDTCTGSTGEACVFACEDGFQPDGPSVCGPNNHFSQQHCAPGRCSDGVVPNSNRDESNPCMGAVGTVCDYVCDEDSGYVGAGQHVCGADGTFSGGSCTAVACNAFVPPLHSEARPCGRTMGSMCESTCLSGFTGNGSGMYTCSAAGVWAQPLGALPLNCTDIDECEDADACSAGQACVNTLGAFECGGCAVGSQSDGAGGCGPIVCTSTVTVPNADIRSLEACTGEFGDACTFACRPGYTADGQHACQASGEFSGGACVANRCTVGGVVAYSNRHEGHACSGVTSSACRFECDEGFTGSGQLVCQASGSWTDGICERVKCGMLNRQTDPHAHACGSMAGQLAHPPADLVCTSSADCAEDPETLAGTSCTLVCDAGWRGEGAESGDFVCGADGEWVGELQCRGEPCAESTVEHSSTVCEGVTGHECNYHCDEGFVPSGAHICSTTGEFSGGSCIPRVCTEGLTIPNSNVRCTGTVGTVCAFECLQGFEAVGAHVCSATGEFSGGICVALPPPPPTECSTIT